MIQTLEISIHDHSRIHYIERKEAWDILRHLGERIARIKSVDLTEVQWAALEDDDPRELQTL